MTLWAGIVRSAIFGAIGLLICTGLGCNESSERLASSPTDTPAGSDSAQKVAADAGLPDADDFPLESHPAESAASVVAESSAAENVAATTPAKPEQSAAPEQPAAAATAVAPPQSAKQPAKKSSVKTKKVALAVPPTPAYIYQPEVVMSGRDSETCLIKVGDMFPEGILQSLAGKEVATNELLGEKLTLVVFWSSENRLAREQIQRLPIEVTEPFKNTGLNVLAVNVGDPKEAVAGILAEPKRAGISLLLDPERSLFTSVAKERIPRSYLLDKTGKILWLDIEYSRSMARDLKNAIHVYLGNRVPSDS